LYIKKSYPCVDCDYVFESGGHGCAYVMKAESFLTFCDVIKRNPDKSTDIDQHDWLLYTFARSRGLLRVIDSYPSMKNSQYAANDFGVEAGFKSKINRLCKVSNGWYREQISLHFRRLGIPTRICMDDRWLTFSESKIIPSAKKRQRDTSHFLCHQYILRRIYGS
jgi:rhamnosyltransferase